MRNLKKKCSRCQLVKGKKMFSKDKNRKDGYYTQCKACQKVRRDSRPDSLIDAEKVKKHAYYAENKTTINEKKRLHYLEKRHKDPLFKLKCNMRNRLYFFFKGKAKSEVTETLLGATFERVMKHVEDLFQPGMSWENYGEWEIDHKIPLGMATDECMIKKLCNYENLQPLWKTQHRVKTALDLKLMKTTSCDR